MTPEAEFPLARLTTVRTGGPAEFFARAGTLRDLRELLMWAAERSLPAWVIGSGSNLLVADEGVRGLVLKLDRELARVEARGRVMRCGGGARLPSVAARAAALGLSGIEFGVNIPGTVGGAVRMNANAYGGALAKVLGSVTVVSAVGGTESRGADDLDFGYRSSNLAPGEVVARAEFLLTPAASESVKRTLAAMRERRHAAQPKGIKTFGSSFKNPAGEESAGMLLARAGCAGLSVGGARFSPKHANFVENTGTATTKDILALMAEGRKRVREQFGVQLEAEVQTLGTVRW
ncbi:MAG: UDP-N-acetylmuramate dehydrogenase [Solirubrobacteraceae bacterium]